MATARQLKGDVGEAIALTSKALSMMRSNQQSLPSNTKATAMEDIADTLLFLGKLRNLRGEFGDAVASFEEALDLYRGLVSRLSSVETGDGTNNRDDPTSTRAASSAAATSTAAAAAAITITRRKELTALSHLASAQSRLARSPTPGAGHQQQHESLEAEAARNFETALSGLSETVGWNDGMTNHTAHEWALFYKRNGDYTQALSILATTKDGLSNVFGAGDHRVLQLHGEIAELLLKKQEQDEQEEERKHKEIQQQQRTIDPRSDHHDDGVDESSQSSNVGTVAAAAALGARTSPAPTATTAEDDAMALLEEALDGLPPNSPEARRIFMQLEEWKEEREREELSTSSKNNNNNNTSQNKTDRGVVVTVTKGRRQA